MTDNNNSNAPAGFSPEQLKQLNEVIHSVVTERNKRFESQFEAKFSEAKPAKEATPVQAQEAQTPDEVAQLRRELTKERELRITKEKEAKEVQAYGQLKTRLADHLRPESVDQAARLIFKADQLVKADKDQYVWHDGRSVDEGLTDWLGSNEAAAFKPAPKAYVKVENPFASTNASKAADPQAELMDAFRSAGLWKS